MPTSVLQPPKATSRSIGFPESDASGPQESAKPVAMPVPQSQRSSPAQTTEKRRKGRWFVTLVITSIMGFVAVSTWNEFFRFQAYGQLEGTVVCLSSAAAGNVRTVHVKEGEWVERGQLLIDLDVRDLEFQRQQLTGNLQLAISDLQVRLAELSSRDRQLRAGEIDRKVRYHQLLGQFHEGESTLKKLSDAFDNRQRLGAIDAIAKSELVESKTAYDGQKAKLADMADAIRTFEVSTAQLPPNAPIDELLQLEQTRIANLQGRIQLLNDLMYAKQLRAPVAGRILKRMAEPGEYLPANFPVLELVQSGSVEAVVYLPQRRATTLEVGQQIQLKVTATGQRQTFRVDRVAPEVVKPPQSIQANYRAFKNLVRVHAKPVADLSSSSSIGQNDLTHLIGAELSLPSFWFRAGRSDTSAPTSEGLVASEFTTVAQNGGE